ncbi:MAG: hypothetical protein ACPL7O_11600, partial [Armatimonadota bacterium]
FHGNDHMGSAPDLYEKPSMTVSHLMILTSGTERNLEKRRRALASPCSEVKRTMALICFT